MPTVYSPDTTTAAVGASSPHRIGTCRTTLPLTWSGCSTGAPSRMAAAASVTGVSTS
jgi:hypothetical protein